MATVGFDKLESGGPAFFVIIVHGTTFDNSEPATAWWKRDSGLEFPFCKRLQEELKRYGFEDNVWGVCEHLGMQEFHWSGKNDHYERLRAASQLAKYINMVGYEALKRYGRIVPIFVVAHSHGGNVFLASLSELENSVRIPAVFFLGTPIFLIRPRHSDPACALYLTKPTIAVLHSTFYYFSGYPLDEIYDVFSVINIKEIIKTELDKLIPVSKPDWQEPIGLAYAQIPVFGNSPGEFHYVTGHARLNLSVLQKFWLHMTSITSPVMNPFFRFILKIFNRAISGYLAQRSKALAFGLPIEFFRVGKVSVGPRVPSLNGIAIITCESSELYFKDIREPVRLPIRDLPYLNNEDEVRTYLASRMRHIIADTDLVHNFYYRSRKLTREVASAICQRAKVFYDNQGLHTPTEGKTFIDEL